MPETTDTSYHLITTEHKFMERLGLSTFTTGSFYEFLNYEEPNNPGVKPRINLFDSADRQPYEVAKEVLNGSLSTFDMKYTPYKVNLRNYEKDKILSQNGGKIDGWSFTSKGILSQQVEYTLGDLELGDLQDGNGGKSVEFNANVNGIAYEQPIENGMPYNPWRATPYALAEIIELNNYARLISVLNGTTPKNQWEKKELARTNFVADIKSSKKGCVEWISQVYFNLNPNVPPSHPDACIKKDLVKFKLYLFDHKVSKNSKRSITFEGTPTLVGPTKNETGTVGQTDDALPDNLKDVAQELAVMTDSTSGKARSGSLQIIGILKDDLVAAKNEFDPDALSALDGTSDDYSFEELTNQFEPSKGKAVAIFAQNKNPELWAPSFKEGKSCNQDGKSEVQDVNVYNFSKRTFSKGETVLLNQLSGDGDGTVWCVIGFGEDPVPIVSKVVEGKWDFMYLMSNTDSYFRKWKKDGSEVSEVGVLSEQFNNTDYEDQFYNAYYKSLGNGAAGASTVPNELSTPDDAELNSTKEPDFVTAQYQNPAYAYWQLTSWDFMGKNMAGVRGDKHSAGATIYGLDEKMVPTNSEGDKFGNEYAPFFGAVFENGYIMDDNTKDTYKGSNIAWEAINDLAGAESFWETSTNTEAPFAKGKTANRYSSPDGMFSDESLSSLSHLPADIALHSSPEGVNGRPLTKLKEIEKNLTLDKNWDSLWGRSKDYFGTVIIDPGTDDAKEVGTRYAWLRKDLTGLDPDLDKESFDLLPHNKTRIQFRPLLAESFLSLQYASTPPGGTNVPITDMAERGWQSVDDNNPPLSRNIVNRHNLNKPPSAQFTSPAWVTILSALGLTSEFIKKPRYDTGTFNGDIWGSNPASAVGVIGAVCTIKSANSNSLSFNTTSAIGYQGKGAQAGGSVVDVISFLFGIVSSTPKPAADAIYYWGSRQDNPQSLYTTNLHARVFGSWPRELTVYDARYFAVHHFNYGISTQSEAIPSTWFKENVETDGTDVNSGINTTVPTSAPKQIYNDLGVYYPVDSIVEPEADFREPTWSNFPQSGIYSGGGTYTTVHDETDNELTPPATTVYSDTPLRNKEHWKVNNKRRGKLLPFKYKRKTIGVGNEGDSLKVFFSRTITDATTDSPKGWEIIGDTGQGYEEGDTFTTMGGSGTGVTLRVNEVNHPGSASLGSIKSFEVIDGGKNFNRTDFMKLFKDDGNEFSFSDANKSSSVKLYAVSVKGTGFEGWITKGKVIETQETVAKPPYVGQTLASPPTWDQSFLKIGGQVTNMTIPEDKVSSDGKYDVFMFFHNDIGHTFMYAQDYGSFTNSYEQYISLTLLPD